METHSLAINILRVEAERPPRRQLVLMCNIGNNTAFDLCILDAWVTAEALNGIKLAEGRLFQPMYNRVDPAIIPARGSGLGALHIELPAEVIQEVEEQRTGGDIKLAISSRVLIAKVSTAGDVTTLQAPFETQFGDAGLGRFEYLIPQSEWLKLLRNLDWSELEILELPSRRFRAIPSLARAIERFKEAQESYRRGDWEASMLNCRKAFEAIVQDTVAEADMSKAHQALVSIMGEGDKTDRLDDLVKSLGRFLHLGRHENLPPISIKRPDAELALRLTGTLLSYLGQQ
jgi:hypothetical protein